LIEHPGPGDDVLVLRSLRPCSDPRSPRSVELTVLSPSQQCYGDGAFQRGRGRQSGPGGHVTGQHDVSAPEGTVVFRDGMAQHPGDARRVSAPVGGDPGRQFGECQRPSGTDHTVRVGTGQRHDAVRPGRRGHGDALSESKRQYEAVVVVGVLTNQIHTTGGGPYSRRRKAVDPFECRCRLVPHRTHGTCARMTCSTELSTRTVCPAPDSSTVSLSALVSAGPTCTVRPGITPT